MKSSNSHQLALVTGGGQGIGKGIAKHLVAKGMSVIVADKDNIAAEETAEEFGPRVTAVVADVSDESSVTKLMSLILSRFGRLDALINNAGATKLPAIPVEQLELEDWNYVINTNLTSVFLCSKHAVPLLRSGKGNIVNIASTRALQSEAHTEAYAASKGGIVALTHALAVSLGPKIRVNCISPGWIAVNNWQKSAEKKPAELSPEDHAQHPVGRVGHPEDVAAMVSYLISPEAGFVTGQNFLVDGGMTRKMIYAD